MTLGAPLWLLALLLIPIGIIASVRARRRVGAVRFPALATLRTLGPMRGGWMRHLPAGLFLLAVGLLAGALARPRIRERSAVGTAAVMVIIDHSGSMAATDVVPTRLGAARSAANRFIDQLPSTVEVGAIDFSTRPDAAQGPVADHTAARGIIAQGRAGGGTDTGDALRLALELLRGGEHDHPPSAIVLLSDGAANAGPDPVSVARQAGRERIPIDTLALGTPSGVLPDRGPHGGPLEVPPDPALMRELARVSRARSYDVRTASRLSTVYERLGRELGSVERTHDLTVAFVIAAGVCALLAALGSMRWAGVLP